MFKIGNLEVYGVIYKIENKINHKVYIGQTVQGFDKRYAGELAKYTCSKHLKSSIQKYGIDNFDICKIFDIAFSRKELDIKEIVRAVNESFGIIQGICWLGGEPFFQFDECIKISKRLKQLLPNIPVTAYTGYTIENLLEKNSDIPKYFDLIIDGQWNGHPISDPLTNQRFWKSQNNKFIQLTYEQYKNIKF